METAEEFVEADEATLTRERDEARSLLLAATNQRDDARAALTHKDLTAKEWADKFLGFQKEWLLVTGRIEKELADEQAAHEVTRLELATVRNELTWERGWDLLRKAQMGAVVEAARVAIDNLLINEDGPGLRGVWISTKKEPGGDEAVFALRRALSVLDASHPEPASEPEAPHSCICYHAPEQHRPDGCEMTCGCKWDGKLREDTPSGTAEGREK